MHHAQEALCLKQSSVRSSGMIVTSLATFSGLSLIVCRGGVDVPVSPNMQSAGVIVRLPAC